MSLIAVQTHRLWQNWNRKRLITYFSLITANGYIFTSEMHKLAEAGSWESQLYFTESTSN